MSKLIAVMVLTVASTGVWANEFVKGFHSPDGAYVAGHSLRDDDQLSQASQSRSRARDDAEEDESLVAEPQDNTLGALGNTGRRDPRVLRNAESIEQIVEQENGKDGIADGDTFYVRKSAASEYNERRIPNGLRANESTSSYELNASSYITNNQKLNKYRELFESNR
jgi:hypothetical protein